MAITTQGGTPVRWMIAPDGDVRAHRQQQPSGERRGHEDHETEAQDRPSRALDRREDRLTAEPGGGDEVAADRAEHDEPQRTTAAADAEVLLDVDERGDRSVVGAGERRGDPCRRQRVAAPACPPAGELAERAAGLDDRRLATDRHERRRHHPGRARSPRRGDLGDAALLAARRRGDRLHTGASRPPSLDEPADRRREQRRSPRPCGNTTSRGSRPRGAGRRRFVGVELDRPVQRVAVVVGEHRREGDDGDEEQLR